MNSIKLKKTGNNKIHSTGFLKRCKITIYGSNNSILIGDKSILDHATIYIKGNDNCIELSDKVGIKQGELYIEDHCNRIQIGSGTQLCGTAHLACTEGTSITIGKDCLFSSDITLRTGDSHSILNLDGKRINPAKSINVCDRVWIGNSVIILKNTTILEDSIIGSGSVVTKEFHESNVVIGGNPANILKRDVCWIHKRI
ncbi:acyltransferase [Lachnospiraceae bacterium ZAX-1]